MVFLVTVFGGSISAPGCPKHFTPASSQFDVYLCKFGIPSPKSQKHTGQAGSRATRNKGRQSRIISARHGRHRGQGKTKGDKRPEIILAQEDAGVENPEIKRSAWEEKTRQLRACYRVPRACLRSAAHRSLGWKRCGRIQRAEPKRTTMNHGWGGPSKKSSLLGSLKFFLKYVVL